MAVIAVAAHAAVVPLYPFFAVILMVLLAPLFRQKILAKDFLLDPFIQTSMKKISSGSLSSWVKWNM